MWIGSMFRHADGVIVGFLSGPTRQHVAVDPEFGLIDGKHDGKEYRVVGSEIVERAIMTPSISKPVIDANGVDECMITGLPDPCMLEMRGGVTLAATQVTGGEVIITTTVPGVIVASITADPTHKKLEVIINAV